MGSPPRDDDAAEKADDPGHDDHGNNNTSSEGREAAAGSGPSTDPTEAAAAAAAPPAASAPAGAGTGATSASGSMDHIYRLIMQQKSKDESPGAERRAPSPLPSAPLVQSATTLGISLRGSTVERLLGRSEDGGGGGERAFRHSHLGGLGSMQLMMRGSTVDRLLGSEDGGLGGGGGRGGILGSHGGGGGGLGHLTGGGGGASDSMALMMRSNTMANILHTLAPLGGGTADMDDMIFDWSSLPQEKFLEGLNNDMRDIGAAPPNAWSLRRTFTLERMLSGPHPMEAMQHQQQHDTGMGGGGGGGSNGAFPAAMLANVHGDQDRLLHKRPRLQSVPPDGPSGSGPAGMANGGGAGGSGGSGSGGGGSATTPGGGGGSMLAPSQLNLGGLNNNRLQHGMQYVPQEGGGGPSNGVGHGPSNGHLGGLGGAIPVGVDLARVNSLQDEAARLTRDNEALNQQLDIILAKIGVFQEENSEMKQVILQACANKGIAADLPQLNQTLSLHRPPPVSDDVAGRLVASVLAHEQGDVMRTMQHLLSMAVQRMQADNPR